MNRDEKGRISPAQSKVALSMRTMGQMSGKPARHAYGESHSGVSGMARMADLKDANKGKRAKSRVILRGKKKDFHTSPAAMKKKGYEGS